MKIIFIAGPFRGDGRKEAKEKNIDTGMSLAKKIEKIKEKHNKQL